MLAPLALLDAYQTLRVTQSKTRAIPVHGDEVNGVAQLVPRALQKT
jgi:hypothetical protein